MKTTIIILSLSLILALVSLLLFGAMRQVVKYKHAEKLVAKDAVMFLDNFLSKYLASISKGNVRDFKLSDNERKELEQSFEEYTHAITKK